MSQCQKSLLSLCGPHDFLCKSIVFNGPDRCDSGNVEPLATINRECIDDHSLIFCEENKPIPNYIIFRNSIIMRHV